MHSAAASAVGQRGNSLTRVLVRTAALYIHIYGHIHTHTYIYIWTHHDDEQQVLELPRRDKQRAEDEHRIVAQLRHRHVRKRVRACVHARLCVVCVRGKGVGV